MSFEQLISSLSPKKIKIKKGESLFQQGDTIENLYFIVSGKIKLIRDTIDGNPVLLHMGHESEPLAEASLFSDSYHCSAIAESACELKTIKRHTILDFLEENPAAMMNLLAIFARQVRDLRTINEIKNIRSANERILSYLRCNIDINKELMLTQTLKDIAHRVGLTHETFYRELKKLEEAKVLQRMPDRIKLL